MAHNTGFDFNTLSSRPTNSSEAVSEGSTITLPLSRTSLASTPASSSRRGRSKNTALSAVPKLEPLVSRYTLTRTGCEVLPSKFKSLLPVSSTTTCIGFSRLPNIQPQPAKQVSSTSETPAATSIATTRWRALMRHSDATLRLIDPPYRMGVDRLAGKPSWLSSPPGIPDGTRDETCARTAPDPHSPILDSASGTPSTRAISRMG